MNDTTRILLYERISLNFFIITKSLHVDCYSTVLFKMFICQIIKKIWPRKSSKCLQNVFAISIDDSFPSPSGNTAEISHENTNTAQSSKHPQKFSKTCGNISEVPQVRAFLLRVC
jgi:hypothetical protein